MPSVAESLECRRLLAAGDLDLSFGNGGKVTTSFSISAYATSMAIQSDDKIVIAGSTITNKPVFALARYNSDGSLDTSFDGDGKLTTDFGTPEVHATSMAVQADGKIVVAGYTVNGSNYDFALARYNSDGSLDTSFDGDGKLTTAFGTFEDVAYGVAVQTDGKIVAAGFTNDGSNNDFAMVRYNSDGSLDTSFDRDGKLTTDFGTPSDRAKSVVLQVDGKIVIAGNTITNKPVFALARYNSDGSLDTSFDRDGKLVTDFGTPVTHATSMVFQASGKIVIAGITEVPFNGTRNVFALARYNGDGSLDTSFDGDGKRTAVPGETSQDGSRVSVAVQGDGKIIVAGSIFNGSSYDVELDRYNSDGSLDVSFDGDGKLTTAFGSSDDYASSVALQADGKIIMAGFTSISGKYDFALARYSNPVIDEPPVITSVSSVSVEENMMAIQTVIASDREQNSLNYSISGGADAALVAINSTSGALSFSAAPDFEHPADANHDNVYLVTVRVSDGVNVVTQQVRVSVVNVNEAPSMTSGNLASIPENSSDVLIIVAANDPENSPLSYSLQGGPDVLWFVIDSTSGALRFSSDRDFEQPTDADHDNVYQVQVAVSDGRNVIQQTIAVAVADVDETPIPFDGGGRVTTDFGRTEYANSMALQSDGRIVVAGNRNGNFAVARYISDGSLDTSFSGDGKVTTDFGTTEYANSVAIQSDGKIVVAGSTSHGPDNDQFALARYNSNGTLDTSFDGDGKVTTDFGTWGSVGRSVVIQPDGKIVVAGKSFTNGRDGNFALARYNSNGSLDTSFDADGKLTTDFEFSANDYATSVTLQPDGKILVAGYSSDGRGHSYFALARYTSNGTLDSTFDGDGRLITAFGDYSSFATSVAIQVDGKIVVAGHMIGTYKDIDDFSFDFALARYNSDGSLDTSFDGDGKSTTDFGGSDSGLSMTLQPDGKVIVAGSTSNGIDNSFALARYNSSGSLDTSFDGDGMLTTSFGAVNSVAKSVVIQPDGTILAAGYTDDGNDGVDFALARYEVHVPHLPYFLSASNFGFPELTPIRFAVAATNPLHTTLSYSLVGGADAALFSINSATGELSLSAVTDFEQPQDANRDNIYLLTVQVTDGTNVVAQNIRVTVTNINEAPTITSSNLVNVPENTTTVTTITASDPERATLQYSLIGGSDQAFFDINSTTGALSFRSAANFERPADTDGNSVYLVTVQVSDGKNVGVQDIRVTVTDVVEPPDIVLKSVKANGKNVLTIAYDILDRSLTGPLNLRFLQSENMRADATDVVLSNVAITKPVDLEYGPHEVSFTIGTQVKLPGAGVADVAGNYFILAVADPANLIAETDNDPLNEDNTVTFAGAYAATTTIMVHGGLQGDSVIVTYPAAATGSVRLTLSGSVAATYNYAYQAAAQFRVRTFDGNDTVKAMNPANLPGRAMLVLSGDGDDCICGAGGADTLRGGAGNDTLSGMLGNDLLDGGAGYNTLTESGNVNFVLTDTSMTGIGTDKLVTLQRANLTAGAGNNIFTVSSWTGNGSIAGAGGVDRIVAARNADMTLTDNSLSIVGFGSLSLSDIETASLSGGSSNNKLIAEAFSRGSVTLSGGDGNDLLVGGLGSDDLQGLAGDDSLQGNRGNDKLSGGNGKDMAFGGAGDDSLTGGAGGDRFLVQVGDRVSDLAKDDARISFADFTGLWTDSEILLVDQQLSQLVARTNSTRLLKLSDGGGLIFERWTDLGDDTLADNDSLGSIRFANLAFQGLAENATVIHEIGHNWDGDRPNENKFINPATGRLLVNDFQRLSGWVQFEDKWLPSEPDARFVSDYATSDPFEDFSETLAATFLSNARYQPLDATAKVAMVNLWLDSIRMP